LKTNLVIGSDGFVGRPLCEFLERAGEGVVRFDVRRTPSEDGRTATLPLQDVDFVYFLAWDVGGAKYLYQEHAQFRQLDWNLSLMLNVMPQLQSTAVPFLFVSSQLAEETDTVYGVTKRLGEVWTRLLSGIRVRLWNVYGPAEEPSERSHVVSDFVHQALDTGVIRMLTDGSERRQFIHVHDVCRGLHHAAQHPGGGVYDVTSFEWVTVRYVADLVASVTGAAVIPADAAGSTPITPIQGKLPGWFPTISLAEGIRGMIPDDRRMP